MSKRKELAQKRARKARRQQLIVIGVVAVVALGVIGWTIYQSTAPIGPVIEITKEALPFANGKVLGSTTATVVVQEFSDFQ